MAQASRLELSLKPKGWQTSRFVEGRTSSVTERQLIELADAIKGGRWYSLSSIAEGLKELANGNFSRTVAKVLTGLGGLAAVVEGTQGCATPVVYQKGAPFISYDWGAVVGNERSHTGIDIDGEIGTSVLAVAPGIVELVQYEQWGGNVIRVYHGQTKSGVHVVSAYVHLNDTLVKAGQEVTRGQKIGTMGRTGSAIGPSTQTHLHLTVIDIAEPEYLNWPMEKKYPAGLRVDPKKYFPRVNAGTKDEKILVACFVPGRPYNFPDITFTHPAPCR